MFGYFATIAEKLTEYTFPLIGDIKVNNILLVK
jgi:hypothetical protein